MLLYTRTTSDSAQSIARIAATLTFDPSRVSRFFKRFAGTTPRQYRAQIQLELYKPPCNPVEPELLTI